jgi:hypothetical protein
MRRPLAFLAAASVAACGGHTAPASTAPDAARAPRPAAPVGDPTTLRYAGGPGRYRLEVATHTTQEAMGQVTDIEVGTQMLVSSMLVADAGNVGASFTVDSISSTSSMPQAAAALEGLRGKTFRAVFTPLGAPVSFTPPDTSILSAGGGDVFREFLPPLPTGTLAAGTTWTDTSNQSPGNVPPGMTLRTQAVRQHRVVGWELRDGVRALRIATHATYTISGGGESQGQQLQLTGTGAANVERFVSAAGVYLGATAIDTTNMTVNVVSVGIEVPVHQVRRSSVSRLP